MDNRQKKRPSERSRVHQEFWKESSESAEQKSRSFRTAAYEGMESWSHFERRQEGCDEEEEDEEAEVVGCVWESWWRSDS